MLVLFLDIFLNMAENNLAFSSNGGESDFERDNGPDSQTSRYTLIIIILVMYISFYILDF